MWMMPLLHIKMTFLVTDLMGKGGEKSLIKKMSVLLAELQVFTKGVLCPLVCMSLVKELK